MAFPRERPRRNRNTPAIRRMVREHHVTTDDLVYPLFVVPGQGRTEPIPSMPGVMRYSIDRLVPLCEQTWRRGVPAVILFGVPDEKDDAGSDAMDRNGLVPSAIHAIKQAVPDLCVITDVCLCAYLPHGHCGVVEGGCICNDSTCDLLAAMACCHAQAGADIVAPSDMMDGRVGAIRNHLDGEGLVDVGILSYAVKYASAYYGPFRDACDSAPAFGDRRTHQMDPANGREALREVRLDVAEGADMLMVKPALAYLDVIRRVREATDVPIAAYNVSGEYAMVKAAAAQGWIDEKAVVLESLAAMKRAGADIILTYHALDVAEWLHDQ